MRDGRRTPTLFSSTRVTLAASRSGASTSAAATARASRTTPTRSTSRRSLHRSATSTPSTLRASSSPTSLSPRFGALPPCLTLSTPAPRRIGPVKMNVAPYFEKMPIRYTLRSTRMAPRPDGQEGPLEEECFATISFRLVD